MKKKSNFVFKQRRSDLPAVMAAYHSEKYAKHILKLTEVFNKWLSQSFGYTVKCPDIRAELRNIWLTYSRMYN